MRKRLIAALVATASLTLVAAAPAGAQTPTLDPTCRNGDDALIPLRVDLGPLAKVTLRLLCVEEAD